MKSLATDFLALLRVVAFLIGGALLLGLVAIVLQLAGEFVWARPAMGVLFLVIAVAVVVQRRKASGETLVIDLTDEATAKANVRALPARDEKPAHGPGSLTPRG